MEEERASLIRKYSTFERLAARFNPDVQSRLINNMEVAYFSNAPSLATLAAVYGWDKAAFWLKVQILSVDRYNGTAKECDFDSAGEAATLFARKYSALKLTEFMLFFARFKLGFYGKFYGAFDPIALGEAFRRFLGHRAREIGEIERHRHHPGDAWFKPPEGYSSLTWYRELKARAARGDKEAARMLRGPGGGR